MEKQLNQIKLNNTDSTGSVFIFIKLHFEYVTIFDQSSNRIEKKIIFHCLDISDLFSLLKT